MTNDVLRIELTGREIGLNNLGCNFARVPFKAMGLGEEIDGMYERISGLYVNRREVYRLHLQDLFFSLESLPSLYEFIEIITEKLDPILEIHRPLPEHIGDFIRSEIPHQSVSYYETLQATYKPSRKTDTPSHRRSVGFQRGPPTLLESEGRFPTIKAKDNFQLKLVLTDYSGENSAEYMNTQIYLLKGLVGYLLKNPASIV